MSRVLGALITRATPQTSNFTNNTHHLEFNTISWQFGDLVTVSTGSGQAQGIITLASGYYYKIYFGAHCNPDESIVSYRIVNNSDNSVVEGVDGVLAPLVRFGDPNAINTVARASHCGLIVDCRTSGKTIKVLKVGGTMNAGLGVDPMRMLVQALPNVGNRKSSLWAEVVLSATQTTNLASTQHIEFDTIYSHGGITLSTGSGQANGKVTLPAGRKYFVKLSLGGNTNESQFGTELWDQDNNKLGEVFFNDTGATSDASSESMDQVVVDCTAASKTIRVVKVNGTAVNYRAGSRIFIEAIT